ncbi:hypothetical protein J21TS7_52480 [Paenibacillus cineris]|uniref:Uncharacterized protein n=1 Tax=Paenibacillus cineris TaxID=237530 RepID=A0ABQ4LKS3_9BACL|nr:hypothetical protein J21TS7_52480 [Paenibacillus cineris]
MIGGLRSTYFRVVIGLSETVYSAAITEKVMNITKGQTNRTYDPEAKNKRVPLGDWPKYTGNQDPA